MKTIYKLSVCAAVVGALVGCASVDYDVYYDNMGLAPGTDVPLAKGARPQFVETMDLPAAIERYKAAGYVVMGRARKSGPILRWDEVIDYAQEKGASLVLYGALREGTIVRSYYVPVAKTSYSTHSGSIHSNSLYGGSYSYSGSTTTTTMRSKRRSYTVPCYDHFLLFMVKKA